jgi:3-hydroxyisobutyrate dehydrogenase-like beta-hydroxyacid dehydrogenase
MLFKLVNNLQSAVQIVALAEGLRLAEGGGLDLAQVVQALCGGRPGSPVVRDKASRIATRDYAEVQFALRWMLKDVEYALRAAEELGLALPALGAARAVFARALEQGLGPSDVSAVAESYR